MRRLQIPPTIDAIEQAPERTLLSVLDVCATNAERMLISRNPEIHDLGDLRRPEPPDTAPALVVASRHLLGRIHALKECIALYEAALCADLLRDRLDGFDEDCDPF